MADLLGPVILVVAMVGLLLFMIKGARPFTPDQRFKGGGHSSPARKFSDLAGYGSGDSLITWVGPFLGILAVASLSSNGTSNPAQTGALLGLLFAIVPAKGVIRNIASAGLSILGVVAAINSVAALFAGDSCVATSGSAAASTIFVVTMVLFGTGLAVSLLRGAVPLAIGLEVFALVEVTAFLSSPLGVELDAPGQLTAWGVALIFGLFTGWAPRLMFGLLGAAVALTTLYSSTLTSTGCQTSNDVQMTLVVSAAAVFAIVRIVLSRFR